MKLAPLPRIWAALPAAGVGRRMGTSIPKQYLPLLHKPIIRWSLDMLLSHPAIYGAVVVLAAHDPHWDALEYRHWKPLCRVVGGPERMDSVHAAVDFLMEEGDPGQDWVMVHDAVRPCITTDELDRLIAAAMARPDGALLAVPVRDTLKRQEAGGRVRDTASRDGLWHAMTPQLFPLGVLYEALNIVVERGAQVTDESQAMETAGYQPLLVEGQATNLKITRRADLALAEAILRSFGYGEIAS
jgi:2-C-methyl-D-erythritol 4-phosphate cytidylyltransferase